MTHFYSLNLTGIQGENTINNHEGEISIDRVMQEYEAPSEMDNITLLQQNDIRPAVECSGVTLVKKYDRSVPNFLVSLTEGQEIDEGIISCLTDDGEVFLSIHLKQVVVRKVRFSFEEDYTKVIVNLTYSQIEHTYTPDGSKKSIFQYKRINS